MNRVKQDTKLEHEKIANLKILQSGFSKIRIEKVFFAPFSGNEHRETLERAVPGKPRISPMAEGLSRRKCGV